MPTLRHIAEFASELPETESSQAISVLEGLGIRTDHQLLYVDWESQVEPGRSEYQTIHRMVDILFQKLSCEPVSVYNEIALGQTAKDAIFRFGLPPLDALLKNSISPGHILELIGTADSGRTLLLHYLCAHTLLHQPETQITFVDTAGWLSSQLVLRCARVLTSTGNTGLEITSDALDRIESVSCATYGQLLDLTQHFRDRLRQIRPMVPRLFIIDCLATLLDSCRPSSTQGQAILNTTARALRSITQDYPLATVVYTNAALPHHDRRNRFHADISNASPRTQLDTLTGTGYRPMLGVNWTYTSDISLLLTSATGPTTSGLGSAFGSVKRKYRSDDDADSDLDGNGGTTNNSSYSHHNIGMRNAHLSTSSVSGNPWKIMEIVKSVYSSCHQATYFQFPLFEHDAHQ
ncbi:hypothetical protein H4R33_003082 [Dimargaris cristalligena]|uniref:Rad51-like C-terminal domain-containing protein n=1 Tax=Dimargaris cristalligena TaxID=215637 RepID=A0A4P9ZVF2_9FUNG|nr:hypothetical protein H4R33_003082 [Dimargaris cristalligena]RKP37565.1 hypothetical protein BJ085DRAFT_40278 [Dimargaris cristalligena]|eukprot:RKP37565.1 hypothetical protein BJ085DRAFT_40278 [Dimargaris cristalligena]